jgi:aspartyl-tRNA(Asn)/glutamyl-tRNA(Gln) amidotransferase subunit A
MARSAADCALLLQAIAGFDEADPLSIDAPCPDYYAALQHDLRELRVGIPDAFFFDAGVVDAEVLQAVRAAASVLESLGASVREIHMDELAPQDDISIFLSEAVAYHRERYEADPAAFGPSFRPRYERAAGFSGAQYAEARYRQAVAKQTLRRIFEEVDLVLTPTTVVAAGLIPEDAEEGSFRELNGFPSSLLGRNTRPFNYTGAPAISLPCGFTTAGLPIGLQLTARWWAEGTLLRAAHAYQQVTDWHRVRPPL